MAIILYPSGVTETYKPKELAFTDEEIIKIFDEYENIRTARLYEVPNTWCVWGENDEIDDADFNKLGSDILQENIFCPILFIHDTEIDPAWMLTDQMILKGYDQFKDSLLRLFDQVAENVILETQKFREEQGENAHLLFLITVGPTDDKRVLFEFDPEKQAQEFYEDKNFGHFAVKVREYLSKAKNDKLFVIYHDKKSVIFCRDENVEKLITMLIDHFKLHENYEYCQQLKTIYDTWVQIKNKPKRKRKTKNGSGNN